MFVRSFVRSPLTLPHSVCRSAAAAKCMRIQSTGNETLMRQKTHKKRFILHFFFFTYSVSFGRAFVAKRKHWEWRVFGTSVFFPSFCSSVTRRSWVKFHRSFFADIRAWAFTLCRPSYILPGSFIIDLNGTYWGAMVGWASTETTPAESWAGEFLDFPFWPCVTVCS